MGEVANIPQLRFPDFDDEWEEKRLSDIAEKSNVKNRDNEVSSVFTNSAIKGVVNQRDFFDKDIANQNNLDSYYIINHDNFVYNPRISFSAPVGPLNRNHLDTGVMSPLYTILKINNVNLDFIERYFKTTKWHRYMNNIANIGARHDRMNITSSDFMKMPIPLPKDEEQQKIAEFLTAVDTKIEQLSKKQELLGEYKKGLMQQIFSQAIRFKADDGSAFPDWEERQLKDVVDNIGGTALEKHTNPQAKHKFISIGNYGVNGKYIDNGQRVELNNKTKTKLLDKDNLVMVLNDKTAAGNIVGSTILIDESDGYIYNQRSERLICKTELLPIFAWHYLNSKMFRKSVYSISQGGTQIYVNFPSVKELSFSLPSLSEQTKIANFLSSIDTKIEQVGGQLDESKQFKKALLQQMFV
jgi:type I restriction enzyme S subunit